MACYQPLNSLKKIRIKLLEEILRVQRYKDYCASSEKVSGQSRLFNEVKEDFFVDESDAANIKAPAPSRKQKKYASTHKELLREDIIHDLLDAKKIFPHDGSELKLIGEETSGQLDIEPAKIKVLSHRRISVTRPISLSYGLSFSDTWSEN